MYYYKGFSRHANQILDGARKIAQEMGHTFVGTEHYIVSVLRLDGGAAAAFLVEKRCLAAMWSVCCKKRLAQAKKQG